jgi:imidazolonepropionase-like amidohydrolase
MCGSRDHYNQGDLGIVKEGAYADLLLIDGNPIENIDLVVDQNNFKVVIKDGKIFMNTLL